MKKVIASLGLVTAFSAALQAEQQNINYSRSFLRFETPYQTASPERVALFDFEDSRDKHRANHHGDVQFTIFGGQNSSQADAAAYYMPGGLETLIFNASINDANNGSDTAMTWWSGTQGGTAQYAKFGTGFAGNVPTNSAIAYSTSGGTTGTPLSMTGITTPTPSAAINLGYNTGAVVALSNQTGLTAVANDLVVGTGTSGALYAPFNLNNLRGFVSDVPSTENYVAVGEMVIDTNKSLGVMRPWNFGIGYAPNVQFGLPIAQSEFVSSITPMLKRSHWGIGATWQQSLSEGNKGFWLELSTALQRATLEMNLNEVVANALVISPESNGALDEPNVEAWLGSWNGVVDGEQAFTGAIPAGMPESITQAFAQEAWDYGRLDGAHSVTRLADIELKLGYQFICEDNVASNGFVGIVIPTGNKAESLYLAEAIVGNGFHFGLMIGSTQQIQWDTGEETRWTLRSDGAFRYLFQNTQVRSFDTVSNGQWSRYMMVWPSYADEQASGELLTTDPTNIRAYTPGINVFTREVNVTPRAQARMNQAMTLEHGAFKAEFGWNMLVRQAEEISLVNAWNDNEVAFVDASNNTTSLFNITRTIYNDSYQSTPVTNGGNGGTGVPNDSQVQYAAASIKAADLNLNSAASPAAFTNTPYLAIGYAFNEEKSSCFSAGVSYEMSATNGYINDWTLWGKFAFTF
ncbi:hypothetical protein KBC04_04725 [Candidatus Babeliales bacterium]|nr:hypothetical protein [Candidatus Babeliales bacterium]MBP9844124.1 hypothetical protein [Candidatus Babeliales bacterium]